MTISRPKRWVYVLLLVAGLCLSFVAGRLSAPEIGAPPALEIAREIGVAIPEVQLPAFSDGSITFQEVTEAVNRFRVCVKSAGFSTGWSATLQQDGSLTIFEDHPDREELSKTIFACRIEHVDSTRSVYVAMQRAVG